jgi:hypothetical protein
MFGKQLLQNGASISGDTKHWIKGKKYKKRTPFFQVSGGWEPFYSFFGFHGAFISAL